MRGWLRAALVALYVLALLELASRAFWWIEYRVPLVAADDYAWYGTFYKNFRNTDYRKAPPTTSDREFDVLLLGGSVLNDLSRRSGPALDAALERSVGMPVRLFNFARHGHTTRDSALKYRLLSDLPFDLVIVYHGINDTRHNNVAPEGFRADYSHSAWYDQIEALRRAEPWNDWSRLPYTATSLWLRVLENVPGRYVPKNAPNPEWTRFGHDLRSVETVRTNLTEIVETARRRDQALLMPTFAWYLPDDYFSEGPVDYDRQSFAVGIWGAPENVVAGLKAHNAVIRELVRGNRLPSLDLERVMPKQQRYFTDICHLTQAGEDLFIATVSPAAAGPR